MNWKHEIKKSQKYFCSAGSSLFFIWRYISKGCIIRLIFKLSAAYMVVKMYRLVTEISYHWNLSHWEITGGGGSV